jgi:hypothetical protein
VSQENLDSSVRDLRILCLSQTGFVSKDQVFPKEKTLLIGLNKFLSHMLFTAEIPLSRSLNRLPHIGTLSQTIESASVFMFNSVNTQLIIPSQHLNILHVLISS